MTEPSPSRPGRSGSTARSVRHWARRVFHVWLGVELSAGIVGLVVVVALLPIVVVLRAEPAFPLPALLGVLSVSLPLAVLLGASALKLGRQVGA